MVRHLFREVEIILLTALILATRVANYHDVFVGGNVYFTDADCYSRMTRVQMCAAHPGLIVRHHNFENYPVGTTPHTSAPLDYLILLCSLLLKPFTQHALDLSGAFISPVLALVGGWFLWWWSRRMKFRFRWTGLTFYAVSPILVHGTELGRPDHQSLLMLLVAVAVCAEWSYRKEQSRMWSTVSAAAWALALWVSIYEPLILFALIVFVSFLTDPRIIFGQERRTGWLVFAVIIFVALLVEQRLPALSLHSSELFRNWSRIIGELQSVRLFDPIWFRWVGYLLVVSPLLFWQSIRQRITPGFVIVLLVATFGLTMWQARWSYFFVTIFAIVVPALLQPIVSRAAVWTAFALSMFPILNEWDERLWPNESTVALETEHRIESIQLRELALMIRSSKINAFVAPWWISPEIAYWSGQPGVGGSSHESLEGNADSAHFYLATDAEEARAIVKTREVQWVFASDADRVAGNCATVLGHRSIPRHPFCEILDRTPAQAPPFLSLAGQNAAAKLFRVVNNLKNLAFSRGIR